MAKNGKKVAANIKRRKEKPVNISVVGVGGPLIFKPHDARRRRRQRQFIDKTMALSVCN